MATEINSETTIVEQTISPNAAKIREDFIRDFGDAYLRFGLPKLMGNVVGLLLYEEGPLSLDEITQHLGVSKGPVSQIMSRLRDHDLVIRENEPGNRKDFYRAAEDIFGQAFINHMGLFRRNHELSERYHKRVHQDVDDVPDSFHRRVREMNQFYGLMMEHLQEFVASWQSRKGQESDQRRA